MDFASIIKLSAPGVPPDVLFAKTHGLIAELNAAFGPIAKTAEGKAQAGAKGDIVSVGQVLLAAISSGLAGEIAKFLVGYVQRNPRYEIEIHGVRISRDFVSDNDIAKINALALKLSRSGRTGGGRQKHPR
jgi:hypothetical protein